MAPGLSLPRTDGTSSISHSFSISVALRLRERDAAEKKKDQDKENIFGKWNQTNQNNVRLKRKKYVCRVI